MTDAFANFLWTHLSGPVFAGIAVVSVPALIFILIAQFKELRKGQT